MKQKIILYISIGILWGFIIPMEAQSLKDLINKERVNKIADAITGNNKEYNLVGTWNYEGFACELKSDNLLKKAGSCLGTSFLEDKMNEYGEKIGLIPGKFEYVFKEDNTFINNYGTHTFGGTYSLNKENGTATLTYLKIFKFDTAIRLSGDKLCLLLDADKLLKFLSVIGSHSDNTFMKTISSLTEEYDGALLGFELTRK